MSAIMVPIRGQRAPMPRRVNPEVPATEKQVAFLTRLLAEKDHGFEQGFIDMLHANKRACSAAIDELLKMPRKAQAPTTQGGAVTEDGMYRTPAGEIFKVQIAHHGSGNLYAKRMIALDEPREMKTKTVTHDFEYAPGAIRKLTPAMKMSLEEAKAWGALYGSCCRCGAVLTKEESIAAGIGPVCAGKF